MKIAVVTGASTGIGRAVSIALSKHGFKIFLVARSADGLQQTHDLIGKEGGEAQIFPADLSSIASIKELLAAITQNTNQVDLIANIAGIWHGENEVYAGKDFQAFNQKVIIDTFMVGTVAPSLLVHGLLPLMKPGSKIVNLSGTFEDGGKGWLPYYVSKRAIEDLTVGLSQELADKSIQVNCVSPSDTATDSYTKFFPQFIDSAVKPEEIAKVFVELSDPANLITGKVIVVKQGKGVFEAFHA